MADTKIVGGRGFGRDGGSKHKKHKEHKHHHPEEPKCPVCLVGEGRGPFWPPFPQGQVPVTHTIYVRSSGSDKHGKGTLVQPFQTFQHAILFVPPIIPPGHAYTIDVTGLGEEVFPAAYQMPSFQAPTFLNTVSDPSTGPFVYGTPLNVRAYPQPLSAISPTDATIAAGSYTMAFDPDTNLAILTLTGSPRASWANNGVKETLLTGTSGAAVSCVIYGSDATHLFLANLAGNITGDLTISEPSAKFRSLGAGQDATVYGTGGGFECMTAAAIAFQGIAFTCDDTSPFASGLCLCSPAAIPVIELCNIEGLTTVGGLNGTNMNACVIRDKAIVTEPAGPVWTNCFLARIPVCGVSSSVKGISCAQTVFDSWTDSFPNHAPLTDEGSLVHLTVDLINCLFQGCSAPLGTVLARGGLFSFQNVQINGSSADAIVVQGNNTHFILNDVTGIANAGYGVHVQDGAAARVVDTATNITGFGDMKVGGLPVRSWADFYANTPVGNQYDLVTPFVLNVASGLLLPQGNDSAGACSGSRLFLRPF